MKGWPQMRPMIEFCQSNLAAGTQKVKEKLEKDHEVDIIEYGCLGNCGNCYFSPYALVNGKIIFGKTPKDLLNKIRHEIKSAEEK